MSKTLKTLYDSFCTPLEMTELNLALNRAGRFCGTSFPFQSEKLCCGL